LCSQANLAISALGGGLFYLQRSLIDYEIMSMADVRAYVPPSSTVANVEKSASAGGNSVLRDLSEENAQKASGVVTAAAATASTSTTTNHMQIDGITLDNLEVLTNQSDGTTKGSLWSLINKTETPHGTRLLRAWLLRPLYRKNEIDRRSDAVTELACGKASLCLSEIRPILKKTNDLERLLARCHSMGVAEDDPSHPANRQVLYEGKTYTKNKVRDFGNLLKGLTQADKISHIFEECELASPLLKNLFLRDDQGGCFPVMREKLQWFHDNVNLKLAEEGKFSPVEGTDQVSMDSVR